MNKEHFVRETTLPVDIQDALIELELLMVKVIQFRLSPLRDVRVMEELKLEQERRALLHRIAELWEMDRK